MRLGADHYLTKPITADDLLCATRDTLAAPWARLCWDPPPAPVGSTGNAVRATNASAHAWCTEVIETLRGERDDWRFQIAGRLGLYIAIHRPAIPESITIMRCVRSVCAAKALDDDLIRRLDVDLVPASPAVSRARHRHVIWLIDRFEKPSGATRFRISEKEIAVELHTSPSRLGRRLLEQTGIAFHDWELAARLRDAITALHSRDEKNCGGWPTGSAGRRPSNSTIRLLQRWD